MAINPVRPNPVPVRLSTNRSVVLGSPPPTTSRQLSLFQTDTFEPSGPESSEEDYGEMIFQKMFDQAEKRRKDHAAENDPWK